MRWQERDAASKLDAPDLPDGTLDDPPEAASANGVLRLGAPPEAVVEVLLSLADGVALRMLLDPDRDHRETVAAGIACVRALIK